MHTCLLLISTTAYGRATRVYALYRAVVVMYLKSSAGDWNLLIHVMCSYLSVDVPSSAARLWSCRNCGRSPRSECSWMTDRGSSWPQIPMTRIKFGSLILASQLTSRRNSCLLQQQWEDYVRHEVSIVVTMKNVVLWDIKTMFVPHRSRHQNNL
jgi:hypothetical protein